MLSSLLIVILSIPIVAKTYAVTFNSDLNPLLFGAIRLVIVPVGKLISKLFASS